MKYFVITLLIGLSLNLAIGSARADEGFSAKSGSIDVKCGDKSDGRATFPIPSGRTLVSADAQWRDNHNIRSTEANVKLDNATNVVTATGSIWGLDKNWAGDCDGGGHAELEVHGTYR